MKANKRFFIPIVLLLISSCATTYHPMFRGTGYDDQFLGNGKYKIIARGNGFSNSDRVKNIAYLRASELSKETGKAYFYVIDDNLQIEHLNFGEYSNASFDIYQLIIQPTNNGDGISVADMKYRCMKILNIDPYAKVQTQTKDERYNIPRESLNEIKEEREENPR